MSRKGAFAGSVPRWKASAGQGKERSHCQKTQSFWGGPSEQRNRSWQFRWTRRCRRRSSKENTERREQRVKGGKPRPAGSVAAWDGRLAMVKPPLISAGASGGTRESKASGCDAKTFRCFRSRADTTLLTAGFGRLSCGGSQQQAEAGQHGQEVHVSSLSEAPSRRRESRWALCWHTFLL